MVKKLETQPRLGHSTSRKLSILRPCVMCGHNVDEGGFVFTVDDLYGEEFRIAYCHDNSVPKDLHCKEDLDLRTSLYERTE